MTAFAFTLPAVRGIQSGRPCYIAMCPVRMLPKLFPVIVSSDTAAGHPFRQAEAKRIREIARHFTANIDDVTLSAATISVEGSLRFVPLETTRRGSPAIGEL